MALASLVVSSPTIPAKKKSFLDGLLGGFTQGRKEQATTDAVTNAASGLPPDQAARIAPLLHNPETREQGLMMVRDLMKPASVPSDVQEFQYAQKNPEYEAYQVRMANARRPSGGDGDGTAQFGLNPQYGVDAEGNPVLLQLSKGGTAAQTALPEGVKLSKEPIKLDAGTHFVLLDPITRQPVGQVPKDVAGAARAEVLGKSEGQAVADLPNTTASADNMTNTIDSVLNDPALDYSTGALAAGQMIPGTPMKRFGTKAEQLQGQAFLQAFSSLKGGGAITEVEGQKATAAIGRLNTAQSPEDYRQALQELRSVVVGGRMRAQRRAGQSTPDPMPREGDTPFSPAAPTPPAAPAATPKAGTVQDGYIFRGGDPADPKAWAKMP